MIVCLDEFHRTRFSEGACIFLSHIGFTIYYICVFFHVLSLCGGYISDHCVI
jgi:hypothetical protein